MPIVSGSVHQPAGLGAARSRRRGRTGRRGPAGCRAGRARARSPAGAVRAGAAPPIGGGDREEEVDVQVQRQYRYSVSSAAEEQPDRAAAAGDGAEDAERLAALGRVGERRGQQRRAPPGRAARRTRPAARGRRPARRSSGPRRRRPTRGEAEQAGDEHPLAAEQVADPAAEQQQAAERQRVGGDDPLAVVVGEAERRPGRRAGRCSRSSRRGRPSAARCRGWRGSASGGCPVSGAARPRWWGGRAGSWASPGAGGGGPRRAYRKRRRLLRYVGRRGGAADGARAPRGVSAARAWADWRGASRHRLRPGAGPVRPAAGRGRGRARGGRGRCAAGRHPHRGAARRGRRAPWRDRDRPDRARVAGSTRPAPTASPRPTATTGRWSPPAARATARASPPPACARSGSPAPPTWWTASRAGSPRGCPGCPARPTSGADHAENSCSPHQPDGPTPGGQANSALPTWRVYSFRASCAARRRMIGTNCARGSRW